MADISDHANVPIEVKIGEKTYKAQRLTIEELFGAFEVLVKQERIADARAMADTISDPGDRRQFLLEAWRGLPAGGELFALVGERLRTPLGARDLVLAAIRKVDPAVNVSDLDGLLDINRMDELLPVVEQLTGITAEDPAGEPEKNQPEGEVPPPPE